MSQPNDKRPGFHGHSDQISLRNHADSRLVEAFTYNFENFFHPFVGELISRLNRSSALSDLLDPTFHEDLAKKHEGSFQRDYTPLPSQTVVFEHAKDEPYPEKEIDVGNGPYAGYNWELFFHVPLTIAVHLSKNQRFAEAQRWFHHVFDPTCTDPLVDPPNRYWKFLRFRQGKDVQNIDELLDLWSSSTADPELKKTILAGYDAIREKPFQPHAVARTRPVAYQYSVVMKYLDNLIAWGDSLFLQDTIESINEATLRYVLAANLLGPRPQQIPTKGKVRPRTFADIKAAKTTANPADPSGNLWVELEGQFPFNLTSPSAASGGSGQGESLLGMSHSLYFCVPRNDKLLTYWDTVADRLFKIRHCMNIQGVTRQLALFDPPLDPGMLVKAAAAGIDVGSLVNGLNQPVGPARSLFLIQKALELTGEVRALGGALLSALEKRDGEHLAALRQGHEVKIHQMAQEARFLQWKHAEEATVSLLRGRATALERHRYYQRLLGLEPGGDAAPPDTFALDPRPELTEESFDQAYEALVGKYDTTLAVQPFPRLTLAGDSAPVVESGAAGGGQLHLTVNEQTEIATLRDARDLRFLASAAQMAAPALALIPDFYVDLHFWGLGGSSLIMSGADLAQASKHAADVLQLRSAWQQDQGGLMGRTASHQRRADEWTLQCNLAARELMHIGRQILSSLIAEQIARREYLNVKQQIENAEEAAAFLSSKFTNQELYGWMQGEISRLYYEYYRFAFDTARRAERTMKQELMRPELDGTDFVKLNYWDGGRKGLLAGEALQLDLKRMEMAHHDSNRREYELTRHVSLLQLDPRALLQLRATGRCTVSVPEELFDLDCPGHYFRRLRAVAISIPCVSGPYTSVNCRLTLLGSSIRKSPLPGQAYSRQLEDPRFSDRFGTLEAIVTSTAQNDSGLFEVSLRDDRYLPFEGSGAVSQWQLQLPADPSKGEPCQLDYATISDVVLHLRYTAREGGESLRTAALASVEQAISTATSLGSVRLLSVRHELPTAWAKLKRAPTGPGAPLAELTIELTEAHYPFWSRGRSTTLRNVELFAATAVEPLHVSDAAAGGNTVTLDRNPALGNLRSGSLLGLALPPGAVGKLTLYLDDTSMDELWVAVTWRG
jgi:hypothetical protein